MRKTRIPKRIALWLTVCALLLALPGGALAAGEQVSDAADALRLEKSEGTVSVTNASGKAVSLREGLRLYSGYGLKTKSASYAWVSLDSAKAVKLDASTQGQVRKSGKRLELQVTEGKLFFDVSLPLKADESMTIRTATMVTGVRGTAGWVEVLDRYTTRISLLEGRLEVRSLDPRTGEPRTTILVGGQTLTLSYQGTAAPGTDILPEEETMDGLIRSGTIRQENILETDAGLRVETLREEDVPGFAALEVASSPDLQERIEETTDLSVPRIIEAARERLAAEEAEAARRDAELDEQLKNRPAEGARPLFETPEPIYIPTSVNLTDPLDTVLQNALADSSIDIVNVSYSASAVATDPNVDIANVGVPAGKTLNLQSESPVSFSAPTTVNGTLNLTAGTLNVDSGTLTVNGALNVNGSGTLDVNGGGALNVASGGNLNVTGGNLNVNSGGALTVASDGTLNVTDSGTLNVKDGGTLDVNGTLNVTGGGTLNVNGSGELNVNSANSIHLRGGYLSNDGTVNIGKTAKGLVEIGSGGYLHNYGILNVGVGAVEGTLIVNNGGNLEIGGDSNLFVNPNSVLNVWGDMDVIYTSTVTVESGGTLNAKSGSTLDVAGAVNVGGAVNVEGELNVACTPYNGPGALTVESGGALRVKVEDDNPEDSSLPLGSCTLTVQSGGIMNVETGGVLSLTGYDANYTSTMTVAGTLNVNGGAITSTAANAPAVRNLGTMTMNGGTITGTHTGIENLGTLTVNGSTITGGQYGIHNTASGTVTIEGGNIYAGTADGSGYYALYNESENVNAIIFNGTGGTLYSKSDTAPAGFHYGLPETLSFTEPTVPDGDGWYSISLSATTP